MDGPGRSSGFRQSRRSRSQRDRERRRRRTDLTEQRPSSPSSGSERDAGGRDGLGRGCGGECGPGAVVMRHRPPRRRKRDSVSCEEDIIDGFAIASFISLEALEGWAVSLLSYWEILPQAGCATLEAKKMDCTLKPPERAAVFLRRGNKRKRVTKGNRGRPFSEPEAGDPFSYPPSYRDRARKRRRKREATGNSFLETGYICDTESESGDKASDHDMEPMFTVSTRKVLESGPLSMDSSVTKSHPTSSSLCGLPRLSVTPRVSGLQRSQERSLEPHHPDSLSSSFSSSSSTTSSLPSYSLTTYVPRTPPTATLTGQLDGDGHLRRHAPSPPQSKAKSFLTYPGPPQTHYTIGLSSRSTLVKPPCTSSTSSSSSLRPPTPSVNISISLGCGPGFPGSLRPLSHPASGAIFTSSPGLPPPPPLLQVPLNSADAASSTAAALTEQDLLRQELSSRFLTSQNVEREGGAAGSQASGGAVSTACGGPSASSSGPGVSGCASQAQPTIPPLAFQFHQHNHQHQHTHTHQHFTPFLSPSATAPPLFDKYPGKMETLYRHPFFPQYSSSVSGIQPVLPPAGPFSSLQGAFQPKSTSPDMAARLGGVPHHLQPKDLRLSEPFRTSLRINNKPGKWCAMHVRVAWMILRHQEKVKLMQVDPHKLDFHNSLMARIPGAGGPSGLGGLGPLGRVLPSAHELARPATLFTASGGVHPSASTFVPPSTPHSSFITPPGHLDPFGRSPPFTALGSLGSGAFGGLGSPTLSASSVFCHKESSGGSVGGLANTHDTWNRFHRTPPSFPTALTWPKGIEKRDERGKETEKREFHIKDEKDRDSLVYSRHSVRMSAATPSFKFHSNTPISQNSSLFGAVGSTGGPSENDPVQACSQDRDRDRDIKQNSTVDPKAPAPVSSAPDRPCSSSSSAPPTPAPPVCLVSSPLDHNARRQPALTATPSDETSRPLHRENFCSAPTSASASLHLMSQDKKPTHTTTTAPKPTSSHTPTQIFPPVKVKEEHKEEPEPMPISLSQPSMPSHSYDQPSSRHHHATPTAHLSLGPPPSVTLAPPTPRPPHHQLSLSLLDRSCAASTIETYLGGNGGIVVGAGGDCFASQSQPAQQLHSQPAHTFPWDPWRELAAQRREAIAMHPEPHLALRTDPHLARLLQHQHAQRFFEAERAAAVAAVVAASPHHPPLTSASSSSTSSMRQEFSLISHHQEHPPQSAGATGSLLDEDQRTHILREDFERTRYYGMQPHPHLSNPLLSGPSHTAQLDHLHSGLLSHAHTRQPGASLPSPHHPSFYSRLGTLHSHPHHIPNGLLTKTPSALVAPLSVGAPPPLIPSVTPGRASTSPRNSRLGGTSELAVYSTPKDRESR
ncbi:autism susceptibility gene 2 protein homolog isoform X2 [Megalops cyprinoides]|uniref:autism susceptibility gene 2 protein homolog isoform X2 n=1 Tax=Megalops cyprinoides TaxID=118141 RepID=UPI0018647DA1|nr:autism susceptibility gene 2 protein homolog isoform X2 [Megalops cyprinoides]